MASVHCTVARKLVAHKNWVRGVAFAPDSNVFVTASADKSVRVWNPEGKQLQELQGHRDWIWSAAVTDKKKARIATGGLDKVVRIFDISGRLSAEANTHAGTVNAVCFSADGGRVASASYDKTCRIFEMDGREVGKFEHHTGPLMGVAFSQEGLLATVSKDRTLKVFTPADGNIVLNKEFAEAVSCVAFSPDGRNVAVGVDDGSIHILEVSSGTELQSAKHHKGAVHAIAYSFDGRYLVSGGADSTAAIYCATTASLLAVAPADKNGHTDEVTGVTFNGNASQIITTSDDCTVRVWDVPAEVHESHTSQVDMEDID